jgi:putative GTP pyrophosphokinase
MTPYFTQEAFMGQNKSNQDSPIFDITGLTENEQLFNQLKEFLSIQQLYSAAVKEVSTKLEVLNDEFKVRYDHNPIRYMENRIKAPKSILAKLKRNGFPISIHSARENLNDIAGIRVVCCYIDDIYKIAEVLLKQRDITLVREKDYIAHPKENGYRSLHLVVKIPVFLSERVAAVPVEIQIRTVAMDFWASLEHQLRYKKDPAACTEIDAELLECAQSISVLDIKMQNLYKQINVERE